MLATSEFLLHPPGYLAVEALPHPWSAAAVSPAGLQASALPTGLRPEAALRWFLENSVWRRPSRRFALGC